MEEIPEAKGFIQKMQESWDRKWAESLDRTPLESFLPEDPVSSVHCQASNPGFEGSEVSDGGLFAGSEVPIANGPSVL